MAKSTRQYVSRASRRWQKRIARHLKKLADPLERDLEQRCIDLAQEHRWLTRKLNGLGYVSWPDRWFIAPTRACRIPEFLVEFKRRGEKPTPLQWRMIRDLRRRGMQVFVIDTFEKFITLFARARIVIN